jgi:hypothetical protein
MKLATLCTISLVSLVPNALAFSTDFSPTSPRSPQQGFSTKDQHEDIELPNFDELFGRIKEVSPLAMITLDSNVDSNLGFNAIDKSCK